jgi:ribosome-binding protein aMBF1 (putative translation factor)
MKAQKRKRLEAAGWRVGNADEFLGLDEAEQHIVELRLALARAVREEREKSKLTQGTLAKRIGSSQSRVNKMEKGDATVSIDLLLRALFSLGRSPKQVANVIAHAEAA